MQYFHLDLPRWLGTPRLTWRRFGLLLRQLPRESRFSRTVRVENNWSPTDYLLANVYDAVAHGNWQFAAAHRGKHPVPPRPKQLRRPGERLPGRLGDRSMSTADVRRILDRHQRGGSRTERKAVR